MGDPADRMAVYPTQSSGDAFRVGVQAHDREMDRIRRMAMSPRTLELNHLWAFYATEQYDARSVTWDGRPTMSDIDRDMISRSTVLPPGFWNPGGKFDEMPLSMRKPTAPYHLVRVVVDRFTGLLFSARRHPKINATPEIQKWVEALVKASRLWIRFAYARTRGGAMGVVAMTFRFANGKPRIEVHDPRWCTPTIVDPTTGEISALEIRFIYQAPVINRDGQQELVDFWYRRLIDSMSDVRFKPAPVGKGDEPQWEEDQRVDHNLGEFPGVWIRNSQSDDIDGEPDCHGEFETAEAIDRLLSQADQGAVENADPTLGIASDELKIDQLSKGSRHAIKVERGGSIEYVEMSGSGVDSALKVADIHRKNFLEVVRCILENDQTTAAMTATEIERRYSSMFERADMFREQYGEHGVKPLLAKMIRACIKLANGSMGTDPATGQRLVGTVNLGYDTDEETGKRTPRTLPPELDQFDDDDIEIQWPEWTQRGPVDAQAAAGAVATARTAQAIDQQSAVNYLAPYFSVDDAAESLERLASEGGMLDDKMMSDLRGRAAAPPASAPIASLAPTSPAAGAEPQKASDQALSGSQITGIVTICMAVTQGEIARDAAILLLIGMLKWPADAVTAIVDAQLAAKKAPNTPGPYGAPAPPGGDKPSPPAPPTPPMPKV